MASTSPHQQAIACDRARNLVQHIDEDRRPLAALRAKLLLVEALSAGGRTEAAETALAPVASTCVELGLHRLLVDAGLA
jgi:hypothetical protein